MNKRILSLVLVAVLILAGMILLPVAQGEPDHQDATAQQQTIDAVVQARFTQTADAQQQIAMTQAAQTQTAAAEPPSPPTQTAAFEATVNAAFFQAMTATVQVEMIAAVEARGLELITINNLARLEAIGTLDQTARDVVAMAFGPGGKQLVTGSLRGPVRLWDAVSGAELTRFAGHSDDVTAVAINTDGRLIASAGKDGNVRLWDAASGGEVLALSIGVVHSLVFSPDGTKLATGDQNGMVYVWDTATGAQLQAITTPVGAVRALASTRITGRSLSAGPGIRWRSGTALPVRSCMICPLRRMSLRSPLARMAAGWSPRHRAHRPGSGMPSPARWHGSPRSATMPPNKSRSARMAR